MLGLWLTCASPNSSQRSTRPVMGFCSWMNLSLASKRPGFLGPRLGSEIGRKRWKPHRNTDKDHHRPSENLASESESEGVHLFAVLGRVFNRSCWQLPGLEKCTVDGVPLSHSAQFARDTGTSLPPVVPCRPIFPVRHAKLVEISKILDVTGDGTLNYLEFQQAPLGNCLCWALVHIPTVATWSLWKKCRFTSFSCSAHHWRIIGIILYQSMSFYSHSIRHYQIRFIRSDSI